MDQEKFEEWERSWTANSSDPVPLSTPPTPDDDDLEGAQFMTFLSAHKGG